MVPLTVTLLMREPFVATPGGGEVRVGAMEVLTVGVDGVRGTPVPDRAAVSASVEDGSSFKNLPVGGDTVQHGAGEPAG